MNASPGELGGEREQCVRCLQMGRTTITEHRVEGTPICEDCHRERELEKVGQLAYAIEDVDWRMVDGFDTSEAASLYKRFSQLSGPL